MNTMICREHIQGTQDYFLVSFRVAHHSVVLEPCYIDALILSQITNLRVLGPITEYTARQSGSYRGESGFNQMGSHL